MTPDLRQIPCPVEASKLQTNVIEYDSFISKGIRAILNMSKFY